MPIRAAASAIAALYGPYVRDTAITFEETAPDAAGMAGRFARIVAPHPWLVAERDGGLFGYAYGAPVHASRLSPGGGNDCLCRRRRPGSGRRPRLVC